MEENPVPGPSGNTPERTYSLRKRIPKNLNEYVESFRIKNTLVNMNKYIGCKYNRYF